jgi:hypothetical protein
VREGGDDEVANLRAAHLPPTADVPNSRQASCRGAVLEPDSAGRRLPVPLGPVVRLAEHRQVLQLCAAALRPGRHVASRAHARPISSTTPFRQRHSARRCPRSPARRKGTRGRLLIGTGASRGPTAVWLYGRRAPRPQGAQTSRKSRASVTHIVASPAERSL